MAQVLKLVTYKNQPPRHQGPNFLPPYIFRACAHRYSGSRRGANQEKVYRKVTTIHWSDILICGGPGTPTQQIGKERLLPGPTAHNILKAIPFSYHSETYTHFCPTSILHNLTSRYRIPTNHQILVLDLLLLPPQARIILQMWL